MGLVTNMNSSKIKYSTSNSSTSSMKKVNVSNSANITYNVKNDFNKVKPDLMNLVGTNDSKSVNNIADVVKIAQENKNKPKVEMPDYDEEPEEVTFAGCVADTCKGYWNSIKSFGKKSKKKASEALKKSEEVFENLNATVAGACVSITEGVGKFGEAVVDCSALAGTGLISLVTAPIDVARGTDFTDYMYDRTYKFIAKDHVGDTYDKFYDNTAAGKYIKNHSYGFETTRNISCEIGYVGGVIVTSYFTGGTSAIAMAEVATVSGMGKGAQNAYSNGADGSEGAAAALATGLWEGTQFYLGGKINSLSPFTKTSANVATRVGLDTLDGAAEGFAQPFISSIYQKGYIDPETGEYIEFTDDDSRVDRYKKIWKEQGGMKQVATNAAVGFVMSGTAEGLGQVFKGSKAVKNADNISKKLDSVPFEQLDAADKEFVNNARKQLNLADNVSAKEVLNEVDKINKNLNFDKVNVKDMDLTTMKKLSDSVDGLDPKVQKEILDGMLGNKSLSNIKNQGQFDYTMDKYLKSLNMDDISNMDSQSRKILNEYMHNKLTKEGYTVSANSVEDMFDTYSKIKAIEEANVGKQNVNVDVTAKLVKTQPSIKNIDKTQPSIKNLDKTQPSIKDIDKTQQLVKTQPLWKGTEVTQPLNVTQPLWKGTDVTQPLNIKNQTNNTNNVVNNSNGNINKNFKEMDTYELHNSITKELQQLDPADPNYSYKASLIKQKEQLEMKLKNQMGNYKYSNETKSIDMLSPQDQNLVKKYSEKVYKNATKFEKNVTESMMYLEDSNTQLVGLDYRVKSLESIEDKVARLRGYGYSVENAAKEVNDSLRYTLLVDSANYEDTVLQKLTTLKKQGYDIKYVNNSWNNPVYKGLNVTLTSPEGLMVELQFHTENSFKVKQILNHDFYEISRNTSIDGNTKALANEIQKINQELYSDKVSFGYNELELKQKINQLAQGSNPKKVNLTPIKKGENAFEYAKNNNQNARLYNSFDEFSQATEKDMNKWRKYLKKQKYMDPQTGKVFTYEDLINGYIGENPNAPGSYKVLNSVNRAMGANPAETLNNLLVKNMDGTPYVNSNGMYSIRIDSSGGTYSSFYYNPINNVVYGIGIDGADMTFDQLLTRVNSETKALNEALQQGATGESMILGRGSSWHSLEKYGISKYDDADTIYQKLTQSGNIYVDNGFMSCTPEVGGGFMGESVNYIITTKGDTGVGNFSFYNACEKEVLLGSGNKFDITGVRKADNGAVYIYLEQI